MTSLLVELAVTPPSSAAEREALLDGILEKVHAANAVAPKQARIFREYIWFSNPDKPFARTDKKTLKRRDTLLLYDTEIQEFYQNIEKGGTAVDIDLASPTTISKGVRRLLAAAGVPADALGPEDNFLYAGVDSLAAVSISNSLRYAVAQSEAGRRGAAPALTARFVYSHPSIRGLAEALHRLAHDPTAGQDGAVELQNQKAEELLARYAAGLPGPMVEEAGTLNVVLTGSTGSLGCYLLDRLVRCPDVRKVYCLNRSEDARERQTAASERRGLSTGWNASQVEFLQVDLSRPMFGLEQGTYQRLLEETTHIIRTIILLSRILSLILFFSLAPSAPAVSPMRSR